MKTSRVFIVVIVAIMAIVILNGEYPLLADYLQYIRKDAKGS